MKLRRAGAMAPSGGAVGRVNVTPMIDVVMCLIVFYLIVGHLVMERQSAARLPESRVGEEQDDYAEPIVVAVLGGGAVSIDGVDTDADRVESVIAGRLAQSPGTRVRVRAGRELPYEQVEPVIQACRDAGVVSVELATERGG